MRVLFFASHVFSQSGASYALREVVRRVATIGIQPLVVVPDSEDSRDMFSEKEFDVVFLNMQRLRQTLHPWVQLKYLVSLLPTLFRLCRVLKKHRVDVVHFNEITDLVAGLAARICGIPCVCHVRADGLPPRQQGVFLALLQRLVKVVVVPSESTGGWVSRGLSGSGTDVEVIYDHAFDIQEYDSSLSGDRVRDELGLTEERPLVLLVSKLRRKKGHVCFIEAVKILQKMNTEAAYVIVGDALDGHEEEAASIRVFGQELARDGVLTFLGVRRDLPELYAAADVVVHCPTYPDPYPTVVLLGMLMGKPVVGSAIGGIVEQLESGRTGVLVAPNDAEALAGALRDLIASTEERRRLGEAALATARSRFEPKRQAEALQAIYRKVTTSSAG